MEKSRNQTGESVTRAYAELRPMPKTADNPAPRLVKVKDAARYLSISPWTLRKLVQTQQLRIVKLENRGPWLIDIEDLDHFIEGRKEYF